MTRCRFVALLSASALLTPAALAAASAADLAVSPPPPAATVPTPASWHVAFSADLVYATRDGLANNLLLGDAITGEATVTGNDFDFGWAPGVDIRASVTNDVVDFTGRFLGGFNFSATENTGTPLISVIPTFPPLFALGASDMRSVYESQFNSVELNAGRDFGPFNAFLGVRAAWFNETLDNHMDFGGVNQADVDWSVHTTGIGPQIGGAWTGNAGPVLVSVDGRVGYLWTTSDADFDLTQDFGPAFAASGDFSGGSTIAEAGISAGLPLTPTLQLKAGYRVIWMSDMPTALGSVANTDLLTETIASSSEEVLIHGGTVGLVAHF